MIKFNKTLHTDGQSSYWSRKKTAVRCTKLHLRQLDDEFGELRVFFDKRTWNINKDGLIYTDNLFERELRRELTKLGLVGSDVEYSEQGMQGNNYVSCDVGSKFIKSWHNLLAKSK